MKVGITRVRNEEQIIENTLDHVATLVDKIIVLDDASTDSTPDICKKHSAVEHVIINTRWDPTPQGRQNAEGSLRHHVYKQALLENPDWVYYFDADEYADFSLVDWDNTDIHGYNLRLFDYYITEEDKNENYLERQWMGPEYRDILMLFRPNPKVLFRERIPYRVPGPYEIGGYVKHYGKAISIDEWEKTCDYYINHRGKDYIPMFTKKWQERKGKAIHTKSDFGFDLIKWEDRIDKGFDLHKAGLK